ncbi:MAG TPA: M23 family metallopeptidase, partial [Thermoleophilaceae bacterium]|nr:M23 family metallopeptidase [Thermoleophilaceae bacterium]
ASPPSESGGTQPGQAVPRREAPRRGGARRRARGPVLASFSLRRPRLFLYGHPARVSFRIRGSSPVRVRLVLRRTASRAAVWTIPLGRVATGVTHSVPLTGRELGVLPQGSYELRIAGRGRRGRRLRRSPRAASSVALSFFHHRFPLAGPFGYGGDGSRFGAPRRGHIHQGQDLAAAEGTPIVAPRGGVVEVVQYQAGGAGHYAVLDGEGEDRDYVFMHMRTGSVVVEEGQRVRTGQRIGEVGNTGRSFGPHLHFEVWVGGWYQDGGEPIDPLPLLRAWDAWS